MTQIANNPAQLEHQRLEWTNRVRKLIDQISDWSKAQGWHVELEPKTINEKFFGTYEIPSLRVELPDRAGELVVNPIGLNAGDGRGRVDLEAIPTLNRVRFVGGGDQWSIITDSNVPLRINWTAENFVQLAHDLLN